MGPTHFVCKWTDKGTGGRTDGSLWRAVAPAGYVALSDVAVHMSNSGICPGTTESPNTIDPKFRCVHASLTIDVELFSCVWTDKGSGSCCEHEDPRKDQGGAVPALRDRFQKRRRCHQ